ncbi:MAG: c-type cytochrome [Rhodopirellula sp.]|nr:c-type cytochrome [Rhodopirellula sp.]
MKSCTTFVMFLYVAAFAVAPAAAQNDLGDIGKELPVVTAKSPAESQAMLEVQNGFRMELVAAEPLVHDPVAVAFDEDGRMYVVELPPYNSYVVEGFKTKGSIRVLEDTNDDGVYDKSVLFASDLTYPTAIACWAGGVFVGDAPDLLYLKDTTGDGQADQRTVVFTGFGTDKAGEAHLNSIRWGFDNRFHLSTNLSGGDVKAVDQAPADATTVSVRGRGFIFDPRVLGKFELTSGGGQHGLSLDNWGRKFVCSNSVPAQTLMYDDRYVARNPNVEAPAAAVDIAPDGKYTKLFRISPGEPWRILRTRLRKEGKFRGSDEGGTPFGFFTGATGITIYRGDAWPKEYRGNLLVGDVANNLIYRAKIESNGLELVARRADANAEFVASRDMSFRPVQFANAPDGSLYVLDMYRQLIEGAAFLPPEFFKHIDPVAGYKLGRIYRIVPQDHDRRSRPKLSNATTEELVALLDHANGWHRDVAARLLYQRQDVAAVPLLQTLVREGRSPEGRMTAMYSLNGYGRLDEATLLKALSDADANVRVQAAKLASHAANEFASVRDQLLRMADDDDLIVRYQVAFSLGDISGSGQADAIAGLVVRDGADKWMRLALLSSSRANAGDIFLRLTAKPETRQMPHVRGFLTTLAQQISRAGQSSQVASVLKAINQIPKSDATFKAAIVKATVEKLTGSARTQFLSAAGGDAAAVLKQILDDARKRAADSELSESQRVDAIRSLQLAAWSETSSLLAELLELRQSPAVRSAAIATCGGFEEPAAAALIIEHWSDFSPALRSQAAEVLLSRQRWVGQLLDAVQEQRINATDIDPARISLLRQHPSAEIRKRVADVFAGETLQRRQAVVDAYQPALQLDGNVERGRAVFQKNCTACHQLEGKGKIIGADLKGIRQRGLASIMLNVLDPNREVKPKFVSYVLLTESGRVYSGMILSENANSVTIQQPDGQSVSVQRNEIETLKSTALSFMPEGLEKQIDLQAMSDLLEYLNTVAE